MLMCMNRHDGEIGKATGVTYHRRNFCYIILIGHDLYLCFVALRKVSAKYLHFPRRIILGASWLAVLIYERAERVSRLPQVFIRFFR